MLIILGAGGSTEDSVFLYTVNPEPEQLLENGHDLDGEMRRRNPQKPMLCL